MLFWIPPKAWLGLERRLGALGLEIGKRAVKLRVPGGSVPTWIVGKVVELLAAGDGTAMIVNPTCIFSTVGAN